MIFDVALWLPLTGKPDLQTHPRAAPSSCGANFLLGLCNLFREGRRIVAKGLAGSASHPRTAERAAPEQPAAWDAALGVFRTGLPMREPPTVLR